MSYIYDVRVKPFVPCSGCPKRRESPVDYKAPLTGSYTVIPTIGDMYAADVLILLCGGLTCNELTTH